LAWLGWLVLVFGLALLERMRKFIKHIKNHIKQIISFIIRIENVLTLVCYLIKTKKAHTHTHTHTHRHTHVKHINHTKHIKHTHTHTCEAYKTLMKSNTIHIKLVSKTHKDASK
jgi:hypothetical protein